MFHTEPFIRSSEDQNPSLHTGSIPSPFLPLVASPRTDAEERQVLSEWKPTNVCKWQQDYWLLTMFLIQVK